MWQSVRVNGPIGSCRYDSKDGSKLTSRPGLVEAEPDMAGWFQVIHVAAKGGMWCAFKRMGCMVVARVSCGGRG